MDKLNLKKVRPEYFKASSKFSQVNIPEYNFLMVNGNGDPNTSPSFTRGVETLYGVAYTLKFSEGKSSGRDFVVAPLEGLWWSKNMDDFITGNKGGWEFTLMIMMPDWVTNAMVTRASRTLEDKKSDVEFSEVRLERFTEGPAVHILHTGPYDQEGPTLARLHNEYIPQHGLVPTGKHHEIYLSDMRKVSPDKLKTILRQPVKKA